MMSEASRFPVSMLSQKRLIFFFLSVHRVPETAIELRKRETMFECLTVAMQPDQVLGRVSHAAPVSRCGRLLWMRRSGLRVEPVCIVCVWRRGCGGAAPHTDDVAWRC